jgi:DNA repair protein RadC
MESVNQANKLSIRYWAEDDRPREKLTEKGKSALSNAELLAILIGSGNKEESAVALCQRILSDHQQSLESIAKLSIQELCRYKGIGEAKAISIISALELGKRKKAEEHQQLPKISSSQDAFNILYHHFEDASTEEFHILLLNRANKPIKTEMISSGGLVGTVADIRIIFKKALEIHAVNMIVAHNHPSGNLQPSQQDISLTKKLVEAGNIMDVQVLDHLIIAGKKYYSFRDEGML